MKRLTFKAFGMNISFSFWFFAVLTAFFTFGRAALAMYFILPIAIHEAGHFIAMLLCGIKPESVSFTAFSIDIRRSAAATASYAKDVTVNLAGATANLLIAVCLYFFAFQSMRVILFVSVNIAVAIFNVMPVGNLDGGQILRLILERFGNPGTALKISRFISLLLLIPLFAVSIFLVFRGFVNLSLLIACAYLVCVVIARD